MFTIDDVLIAKRLESWLSCISSDILHSSLLSWWYDENSNEITIRDVEYHSDFTFPVQLLFEDNPRLAVKIYYDTCKAMEDLENKMNIEAQEKATYLKLKAKFENN